MATKREITYGDPSEGCLLGKAFQRLVSQLESALVEARLDVSAAEYLVLRTLYDRDGLQQCEIVDALGKDKGAVCRTVSALADKGLVRIEPISHKCRRVWVSPAGRAIEGAIMEVATKRHEALMSIAPAAEMDVFIKILKEITNL